MIVCSCHVVSDRAVREAAHAGLSREEVMAQTRAGTGCGQCRSQVEALVTSSAGPCHGPDACPDCPRRAAA